jgi:Glutathione S-transferase, C-terminal domain
VNLYYEFFDNNGSDFFFKSAYGGHSALTGAIRDDFAARTYDQGIARYTPQEIVDKAGKDLVAVSQVLGDHRFILGTDKPTSFDAAVFGVILSVFQVRGMHPGTGGFRPWDFKSRAVHQAAARYLFPRVGGCLLALQL